jgi:hypothetical protein
MFRISGKKNKVLVSFSILLAIIFVTFSFLMNRKIANGQSTGISAELFPSFGGKVSDMEICCTGEEWEQGSTGDYGGDLLLYWSSIVTADKGGEIEEGTTALGKSSYGGICLDIDEECESGDEMPFVLQYGTAEEAGGGSSS